MSAQHTPGPWEVRKNKWGEFDVHAPTIEQQTGLGYIVADDVNGDSTTNPTYGSPEANARLIAAAPDLLALAEQYASECAECEGRGYVVTYADPYERGDASSPEHSPCAQCADIRAVIAKATQS